MLLSFVVGLLDKVEHVVDRTWRGGDLIFDIFNCSSIFKKCGFVIDENKNILPGCLLTKNRQKSKSLNNANQT